MNPNNFIIRQPKATRILLIILNSFWLTMTLYLLLEDGITGFFFYFLGISSLVLTLTIVTNRWKITIEDNQITYTPLIGKTKSFAFSDITAVERGFSSQRGSNEYIKAYRYNEKLLSLTDACAGFNVLFSRFENAGVYIYDKRK